MGGRVLVPWNRISDDLGDLGSAGLTVEVFDGDSPGPQDLGDVVFFTVKDSSHSLHGMAAKR